jgi:hypothetical protein
MSAHISKIHIFTLHPTQSVGEFYRLKKINFIEDHRHEHRSHNFIGALLMHHTLKSTKYLAKWIEEKNK